MGIIYIWHGAGSAPDPTLLLLHCNGTDGATTITDSSTYARTVTAYGNAQIDTAQSKWGGASLLFDGTGDYAQAPDDADLEPGNEDFTLEAWIRTSTVAGGVANICIKRADNTGVAPIMVRRSGNTLEIKASVNGTTWAIEASGGTLSANTWHHVAVVRNGASIKVYLDGNVAASGTLGSSADVLYANASGWLFGGDTNANFWNGWLDEIRFYRGAVWTSNFTPPAGPYSDP